MNLSFSGNYKSIDDFEWFNVPGFAIITGPNGSGKTQLLELIYNTIIDSKSDPSRIHIDGERFENGEVSFLRSEWVLNNANPLNLSAIQQQMNNMISQFSNPQNTSHQPKLDHIMNEMAKRMGKQRAQGVTIEEFEKYFPTEYLQDDSEVTNQISRIFVEHNIVRVEKRAEKYSEQEIDSQIGPEPWVLLNEIMKEAKLPFEFNRPEANKIRGFFKLEITDTIRNKRIDFSDLSSGEKVLVSLVFFLYTSQENKYFTKFLLLDEPDAHLHPSMTRQFLDIVNNVFVLKHRIRVIMTTHSPSTVALAPEESIFEMSKTAPRITKSLSKNKTIYMLTAGLVIVGLGTKYFIVEDKADTEFYQEVNSFFISKNLISGMVPLVFIPASIPTKSGGKSQVSAWIEKLSSSGLENIIQGVIDRDSGNPPSTGIFIIERYSIENYLLDPLIVYAALMDRDLHPKVSGVNLKLGEEYKIESLTEIELQQISDTIHAEVEPIVEKHFPDFSPNEKKPRRIELATGQVLSYPVWLLQKRGKTLLNEIYNKTFPGNSIHPGSLMKAFKKTHFLPKEMVLFYQTLEKS